MPQSNNPSVDLEFECVELPIGYSQLRVGIQEKQEVVQDVPCTADPIRFHFPLDVTIEGDKVVFSGRYAQGPRDNRFVYLSWGTREGETWQMVRRAKVMLNGIGRERVEAALREGRPLRARIRMTNEKGEPVAAALKPDAITWL